MEQMETKNNILDTILRQRIKYCKNGMNSAAWR